MKADYASGEVVDIDLGNPPNEVKGHEQAYIRPCVVIKSLKAMELAIVVPVTSSKPKQSYFWVVHIPKGNGGLTMDSYVLCHQIRTISFDRIKSRRGKLSSTDLLKIQSVLTDLLSR